MAVLVAACAAPPALAQSELTRGRPEVPEQKPQHDTRPADEDSLEHLIVDDAVAIPLLDEPGAPLTRLRIPPRYPETALKSGVQGTVRILARIARDGSVARARVTKSIPALDRAALDAVEAWQFVPVTADGKPVEADIAIPIRFLLPADPAFDWRAGRAAGAAAERGGDAARAFERYVAAFRAAVADSAAEAESLRTDVARVAGLLVMKEAGSEQRVPPVEAWVEMTRGDSLAARATRREDHLPALAAYRRATDAAPWHAPLYRRLAAAQQRVDRIAAIRSLELCLAADPRAGDRAETIRRLSALRASLLEQR